MREKNGTFEKKDRKRTERPERNTGKRTDNPKFAKKSDDRKFTKRTIEGKFDKKRDDMKDESTSVKGYDDKKFEDKKFDKTRKSNYQQRKSDQPHTENGENDVIDNASLQLEGRNAVLEALDNHKTIDRILVKQDAEGLLKVIIAKAKEQRIVVQEVVKQKLDDVSQSSNHQGVVAFCPAYEYSTIETMLENAKAKNEDPFLIVLDEISDPHNLGAIIRTANASGAHGVIIPKRRAVGMTATVVKSSAGAIEYVPVARITNVSQTLEELKKHGIWIACADMEGQELYEAPLTGPIALVIGNEGEGVGRLVKETSDFAVKIPMQGEIASLNASVAAAIIMYEVVRRRR